MGANELRYGSLFSGIGGIDLRDFNRDGYIDAYLQGSAKSKLYLNSNGNPTFTTTRFRQKNYKFGQFPAFDRPGLGFSPEPFIQNPINLLSDTDVGSLALVGPAVHLLIF